MLDMETVQPVTTK